MTEGCAVFNFFYFFYFAILTELLRFFFPLHFTQLSKRQIITVWLPSKTSCKNKSLYVIWANVFIRTAQEEESSLCGGHSEYMLQFGFLSLSMAPIYKEYKGARVIRYLRNVTNPFFFLSQAEVLCDPPFGRQEVKMLCCAAFSHTVTRFN